MNEFPLSAVNKHKHRYLHNTETNTHFSSKVTRSECVITNHVLHSFTEHSTSETSTDERKWPPVSSNRLTYNLALNDYVTTFILFSEHTELKHAKLSDYAQ